MTAPLSRHLAIAVRQQKVFVEAITAKCRQIVSQPVRFDFEQITKRSEYRLIVHLFMNQPDPNCRSYSVEKQISAVSKIQ